MMLVINIRTSKKKLREVLAPQGITPSVCISKRISSFNLIRLAKKHAKEDYGELLAELICAHPKANKKTLLEISKIFPNSIPVANSVAISKNAPLELLTKYIQSKNIFLREHAALSLLYRELNRANLNSFEQILDKHKGESEFDISCRSVLLTHKRTPIKILKRLSSDEVDSLARTAQELLIRKFLFKKKKKK